MLTTAGLSLAARSTKSGSVCALATWPPSGVSVQNCTSEVEPAAEEKISTADTATAPNIRISFNCICKKEAAPKLTGPIVLPVQRISYEGRRVSLQSIHLRHDRDCHGSSPAAFQLYRLAVAPPEDLCCVRPKPGPRSRPAPPAPGSRDLP